MRTAGWIGAAALLLLAGPARAGEPEPDSAPACFLVCAPSLRIKPYLSIGPLDPPMVRELPDGTARSTETGADWALSLDLIAPTELPRVLLFLQLIWLPFAEDDLNRFTGYTAEGLGAAAVDATLPVIEFGVGFALLRREETGGWLGLGFDVNDQFGPAPRPTDRALYVHRLNLELGASLGFFAWLPEGRWLREVTGSLSLDLLVTGVPRAGDEVPRAEQVFVTDGGRWSFNAGLSFPLAPLDPG